MFHGVPQMGKEDIFSSINCFVSHITVNKRGTAPSVVQTCIVCRKADHRLSHNDPFHTKQILGFSSVPSAMPGLVVSKLFGFKKENGV